MRSLSRLVAIGVGFLVLGCSPAGMQAPPGTTSPTISIPSTPDAATAAVIARYQARIPELMAEQDIPGLSVAVVDGDQLLWAQGFGYVDRGHTAPVGLDTIFSVQSNSKLFTATAVMEAVQAGLVDLDVPITRYVPDFTVHSTFEDHPEQKITLRMLLSHTAGFTHEAPVGNNFELDPGTFDEHVKSISDTWLRFPVGTGYAYSNLGIDLAGYVLERVYGKPFAQVMSDTVLAPIGMAHSTFDRDRIRATADRATGYTALGVPNPAIDVAMTAAGGLYASAGDLARFLSFEIGAGTIDGRSVLDASLMAEQRTVPAPNAGAGMGYALGVVRTRWRSERHQDLFYHGGGGYGFLSDLWWAPSLELGIAILTNSSEHSLQGDLAISIMRDLVDAPGGLFARRLDALPYQDDVVDLDTSYIPPPDFDRRVAALALPASPDRPARWARYAGTYQIATMGIISPTAPPLRFLVSDDVAYFDSPDGGTIVRHRLTEFQPGLFIADNGEVLDFRDQAHPVGRSVDLVPATGGPTPWQWGLLALAGVAAILWFAGVLWAIVRSGRRRRRAGPAEGGGTGVAGEAVGGDIRRWRWSLRALASLTALLALGTIGLLAVLPGLVDSGFLGWLQVPLALRLILHLPVALTVVAAGLVVVAAIGVARQRIDLRSQPRAIALSVTAALFVAQLAAWHLIGWGFS